MCIVFGAGGEVHKRPVFETVCLHKGVSRRQCDCGRSVGAHKLRLG